MTNEQFQSAALAICNSREMCGDEVEAFRDWCADEGIKFSRGLYSQANFAAGQLWRSYQKAANVNPKYIY